MTAPAGRGERMLGLLQAALTAVAVFLCFRGCCQHFWALLVFLALPASRILLSPGYRAHLAQVLARCWRACTAYPNADERPPWQAVFLLVVLPAVVLLLASNFVAVGDNLPVMMAASSLVTEGDWDLDEFLGLPDFAWAGGGELNYTLRRTADGVYSSYPSGPVQFALPVAAAARLCGADLNRLKVHDRLQKWASAWVAAACLALFFLLALHLVEPAPAAAMTALLGAGSAIYTTVGQGLWQHGGVVFWSLVILLAEFRHDRRPGRWTAWVQGAACAMMLACRLSAVAVVVPLGLWLLARAPRRAFAVAAVACLAYAPWGALYASIDGQPFGPSTGQMERGSWSFGAAVANLGGVLFSPGRGFLVYQAWAVLIVAACLPAVRSVERPAPAGWKAFCAGAIAANFLLVSAWGMWWGGWCWGSRLVTDTLPLWALLCLAPVAWLWRSRGGRRLVFALAVLSFAVNAPLVYLRADRWNGVPDNIVDNPARLWSWSRAPFLYPLHPKG
jgi:hypothetical protein